MMLESSTALAQSETSAADEVKTVILKDFDIAHIFCCLVFSLLIFASNAFIVYVLRKGRYYFDEATSFLFQILAYTNLVGGSVGAFIHAMYFVFINKPISDTICRGVPFFITYCSMNSLYLVCLINAQRYFAVTRPFKYIRVATVKRFKIVVCVSNLLVTGITVITLPIEGFPFTEILALTCSDRFSNVVIYNVEAEIGLGFMIIAIGLPLLVLTFFNLRLLAIAYHTSRGHSLNSTRSRADKHNCTICKRMLPIPPPDSEKSSQRHANFHSGLKGLKTVFVTSVLFYVSCLPFAIALILTIIHGEQSYYLYFVSFSLLLGNCWWNGPVYFFTSKTFRNKSLEVLGIRKHRRSPAEASTRESSFTQSYNLHHMAQST